MNGLPLVSLIVPSKNSEATIGECLKSIKIQTYKNIEIIVVDNYSTDCTREIAQKLGAIIYLRGHERASQVNFGAMKAKGKYIYRVDSDFILETSVIEEAVNICEVQCYDAVAVHNTSDSTVSFWSRVRKLERDCVKDDDLNVAARFFRKDVFEKVGGYDEGLVAAEDYDLHNRLVKGWFRIGRINACEVHIGEPRTFAEVIRKHYYYGKNIEKFIEKNPSRGMKQLSPIRPAHIRNWKLFLKNPMLLVGFVIYQTARYVAGLLGYLVSRGSKN